MITQDTIIIIIVILITTEKARLEAEKERLANLAHEERVALHSVVVQVSRQSPLG